MPLTETDPIRVDVTAEDIRAGEPGDCARCPVALAVGRAIDDAAEVFDADGRIYIEAYSRTIEAPRCVAWFVEEFDLNDDDPEERRNMEPFSFELPPFSDPEWRERCAGCAGLCDAAELDGEGLCEECRP